MKTKKRTGKSILNVYVLIIHDDSPDLSHLGEYTNQPGPDDRTIDRQETGDMGRGEYRYFVAAMSGEDTGNPESVKQDYERMESHNRGEWQMIGMRAHARVQFTPQGPWNEITSGGLWGIESDSGDDYFREIGQEQLAELRDQLHAAGFTSRQIGKAFSGVKAEGVWEKPRG